MKKLLLLVFTIAAIGLNGQNVVTPVGITQDQGEAALGGYEITNLIGGAGLSATPTSGNIATVTHTGDSWTALSDGPDDYFSTHGQIRFILDLDGEFELSSIYLWGYVFGGDMEPNDFTLEFSSDNVTYTNTETLVHDPSLGNATTGSEIAFSTTRTANYVRMTITSNHTGGRIGFGELRFIGNTTAAVPNAASGLSATPDSSTQINLSWTDNSSDETGFIIERRDGSGVYATVATVAANTTSYNDSGLLVSSIYTYRVLATNASGDSPATDEVTAATEATNGNATEIITQTGLSQDQGDSDPVFNMHIDQLSDNSGLSDTPTVANILSISHTNDGFTNGYSWVTTTAGEDYFEKSPALPDPRFVITLGASQNLSALLLWGYPYSADHNPSSITAEFSTDGTNFSGSEVLTIGAIPSGPYIVPFSTVTTATHVRLTITDNNGGDRVGLGEIKFVGASSTALSVESNKLSLYNLYPNPASNILKVSNVKETINAKIFNVMGKELFNVELSPSKKDIDVSNLSPGLYFMSINNTRTLKFLKK